MFFMVKQMINCTNVAKKTKSGAKYRLKFAMLSRHFMAEEKRGVFVEAFGRARGEKFNVTVATASLGDFGMAT